MNKYITALLFLAPLVYASEYELTSPLYVTLAADAKNNNAQESPVFRAPNTTYKTLRRIGACCVCVSCCFGASVALGWVPLLFGTCDMSHCAAPTVDMTNQCFKFVQCNNGNNYVRGVYAPLAGNNVNARDILNGSLVQAYGGY